MKLLSYHIENYGKIHDKDGVFSEGITCFCEKNGFGKSTLASFIKAMFYGLPSYTVASKTFNDRQHFYPFGGGKFGGNVTFELKGKTYKIERFFDKKSNKNDECKVYCNGAPYGGFGEDIGKSLFGLDEESFKKTVFITADEIEIASTHSINEKLNRTVEGSDEENHYEAAIAVLEKAKKELKAARGSNDRITEKKNEIVELTAQIKNLKDMSEGLSAEYTERERLIKEIASLDAEVRTAGERNLVLQKWETLDAMSAQTEQKREGLRALKEKYPQGFPSAEERSELHACLQDTNLLRGELQASAFGVEKQGELLALSEKFASGVPAEETLAVAQKNISRLTALETEAERLSACEPTQKERLLQGKFGTKRPSENELSEKRALVEEYKRKEGELKERTAALLQAKTEKTHRRVNGKAYWFVAAIALLGAGAGLLFVLQALGIGLLIAGGIFLVLGVVTSLVNKPLLPSNTGIDLAALQSESKLLEEKIRAFTVPYGYYGEAGVAYDFSLLEEELKAYEEFLAAEKAREAELMCIALEKSALREELSSFLRRFGEADEESQNGLNRLMAAIAAYASLKADEAAATQRAETTRTRLESNRRRTAMILEKYGLDPLVGTVDGLKGLELDFRAYEELFRELTELQRNSVDYREKNGLTERPEGELADANGLHDRLSVLRKNLADLDKRIAETERFAERLPDAENDLLLAEEKLKEYKERHALLSDTILALKAAEQSLKDKYIAPIKDRFSFYAEVLERVLGEKIGMDQDFRIVFERGGEDRSERHLSAGERSLCALCLRLALIDNMYETERPFIIMDDPFVHLDETHMSRTAALVRELSQGKQIVYFCCHESRRIAE